jgi:hypothetical protein
MLARTHLAVIHTQRDGTENRYPSFHGALRTFAGFSHLEITISEMQRLRRDLRAGVERVTDSKGNTWRLQSPAEIVRAFGVV